LSEHDEWECHSKTIELRPHAFKAEEIFPAGPHALPDAQNFKAVHGRFPAGDEFVHGLTDDPAFAEAEGTRKSANGRGFFFGKINLDSNPAHK
jgi:hypothetical protein